MRRSKTTLDSSVEFTLHILEERLNAAEKEGDKLFKNLKKYGFNSVKPSSDIKSPIHRHNSKTDLSMAEQTERKLAEDHISPKENGSSSSYIDQNYEVFADRMCQVEEALNSLHNQVGSIQSTERKAKEKESTERRTAATAVVSNMERMSQEYHKIKGEMDKLQVKNVDLRRKNKILEEAKKHTTSKVGELELTLTAIMSEKESLQAKLIEAEAQVASEKTCRESVEARQSELADKTRQLEALLEVEQSQVKSLVADCKMLRNELTLAKGTLLHEQDERLKVQAIVSKHGLDSDRIKVELNEHVRQRKMLQNELQKTKKDNSLLQEQLELVKDAHQKIKLSQEMLTAENSKLQEALKVAATDNKALISQQRETIQRERDKINLKMQEQDKVMTDAKQALLKELDQGRSSLHIAREENEGLKRTVRNLEEKVSIKEEEIKSIITSRKETVDQLRAKIQRVNQEMETAVGEKRAEITKLKEELEHVYSQRQDAQTLIKELELEKERIMSAIKQSYQENKMLRERLAASEQQKVTQDHFETVMNEVVQSKNKLAYQKGALESEVDQLKIDLLGLLGVKEENEQLRKSNVAFQNQYNKVVSEMQLTRRDHQQLELELKKMHSSSEAKDKEIRSLINAREEALQEAQKLLTHAELVEKRYLEKVASLEASVRTSQRDERKVATNLKEITSSHTQLQNLVEQLQTESGRKDTKIRLLESERATSHQAVQEMQGEMKSLQDKIINLETCESVEVTKLKKEITKLRGDKKVLSQSLRNAEKEKDELRQTLAGVEKEKEKAEGRIKNLKKDSSAKCKALENEYKGMKEKVYSHQDKLQKELLNSKEELKHKDKAIEEMKEKLRILREELDVLGDTQANLEKKKVADLHTINNFVAQVKELQTEINVIAKSRDESVRHLREKEKALENETLQRLNAEEKCKDLEQQLLQAARQNKKVFSELKESESWLKSKLNKLEKELQTSRHQRRNLEVSQAEQQRLIDEEREKGIQTANNAKELIRAARMAVNRLAGEVSENNWEIKGLKSFIDKESHDAVRAVKKYEKLLEASTRRVEELARELDRAHEKAKKKR